MTKRIYIEGEEGSDAARWADIKETSELNAGDRRAVNAATPVELTPEGTRLLAGDFEDRQKNALLARIVTKWNLDWSLPEGNPAVFDKLSLKEIDRLYKAVDEHIEFFANLPNPNEKGSDPTVA